MAIKYGKRTKHNAGTQRKSYNNKTGRTRVTTTVKQANYTRSRSVNKNGSIRTTTTHKSPSGFVTRTTKTFGGKVSKPKAPKFVKTKSSIFKPFKSKKTSSSSSRSSRSRSRSSGSGSGGGGVVFWFFVVLILAFIFT